LNVWFAKGAVLGATAVLVAIRAPHGQRSRSVTVAKSRRGALETFLLAIAWLVSFMSLIWALSPRPLFAFADYELTPAPLAGGVALYAVGLYLFRRSHQDLGTNWSITLEIRERHRLVTDGIYRRIRHPMYLSLIVFSLGQALAVPNWLVGPSYLAGIGLLCALRLGPEERMMREEFGAEYEAYARRTARLLPGVF
jgi:protein-S-isoprenylcysteine O-methyltransferase Ste14